MINGLLDASPQDSYIIKMTHSIDLSQISYLIDLYQPIIGSEAMSLYMTFFNHISLGQIGYSNPGLHRNLMSQLHLSLPLIIKKRRILEAVGLLKTKKYRKKETDEVLFEYILFSPLHPIHFFQSDILSVLLYNRLGKNFFQFLKKKYISEKEWPKELYNEEMEITKSFDEVFDTLLASELKVIPGSEMEQFIQPYDLSSLKGEEHSAKIKNNYLDMEFIRGMVGNLYPLQQNMDTNLIDLLNEFAFLYRLNDMDLIDILRDPSIYGKEGKIDVQLLRKRLREKFRYEDRKVLIADKDQIQGAEANKKINVTDKAKRHRWILEHYSPVELIFQYQQGGKIPEADLELAEALLNEYKLPSGVVNVLIEYVMLSNDYKLPKKLTEKIAGHWKRLKVTTVEEALSIAKKEHKLYREWKEVQQKENKESGSVMKTKGTRGKKEKIPDYILNQEEKYHHSTAIERQEINEEKRVKIEKLLKDLGEI